MQYLYLTGGFIMNKIDKQGKRRKLNIAYIYNQNGKALAETLKEGYLDYLKRLRF